MDIVFDGPPGPECGCFVEVEDENGRSINRGKWLKRPDGFWVLRMPDPFELEKKLSVAETKIRQLTCDYNHGLIVVVCMKCGWTPMPIPKGKKL